MISPVTVSDAETQALIDLLIDDSGEVIWNRRELAEAFARRAAQARLAALDEAAALAFKMQQAASSRLEEKHDDDAAAQYDTAREIRLAIIALKETSDAK